MIIDCGSCTARGQACADCVVTFLTVPVRPGAGAWEPGRPEPGRWEAAPPAVDLDVAERGAIGVLARSGLVPPLRLRQVV